MIKPSSIKTTGKHRDYQEAAIKLHDGRTYTISAERLRSRGAYVWAWIAQGPGIAQYAVHAERCMSDDNAACLTDAIELRVSNMTQAKKRLAAIIPAPSTRFTA
jgi:hypothetical protein